MDTDKKRKTIRCQKCGLTFSGERVYCPLCKKRIIDEGIIRPHMATDIFSRRNRCGRRLCTFDCRTAKVEKYSQNGHV